jgi:predicted O-methyltransferase YrrM
MDNLNNLKVPPAWQDINQDTISAGFKLASAPLTGSLLRTLAASKRQARFLELGTGTGLSTAWILDGMDPQSSLISVDNDPTVTQIARKHLGGDPRLTLKTMRGGEFLKEVQGEQFDYIFADTWPGKYKHLELALNLVKVGGFYIIDDMLPQENGAAGHAQKVADLLETLENLSNFNLTKLNWASGLVLLVKIVE